MVFQRFHANEGVWPVILRVSSDRGTLRQSVIKNQPIQEPRLLANQHFASHSGMQIFKFKRRECKLSFPLPFPTPVPPESPRRAFSQAIKIQ